MQPISFQSVYQDLSIREQKIPQRFRQPGLDSVPISKVARKRRMETDSESVNINSSSAAPRDLFSLLKLPSSPVHFDDPMLKFVNSQETGRSSKKSRVVSQPQEQPEPLFKFNPFSGPSCAPVPSVEHTPEPLFKFNPFTGPSCALVASVEHTIVASVSSLEDSSDSIMSTSPMRLITPSPISSFASVDRSSLQPMDSDAASAIPQPSYVFGNQADCLATLISKRNMRGIHGRSDVHACIAALQDIGQPATLCHGKSGHAFWFKIKPDVNMKVEIRRLDVELADDRKVFSDSFEPEYFGYIPGDVYYEIRCYESIGDTLQIDPSILNMSLTIGSNAGELVILNKGPRISGKETLDFYNAIKTFLGVPKIYICDDSTFIDRSVESYQKLSQKLQDIKSQLNEFEGQAAFKAHAQIAECQSRMSAFNVSIRILKAMSKGRTYYEEQISGLQVAILKDCPRRPTVQSEDKPWTITQSAVKYEKARTFLRELSLGDLEMLYHRNFSEIKFLEIIGTAFKGTPNPKEWQQRKLKDLFAHLSEKLNECSKSIPFPKKKYDKLYLMQLHLIGMFCPTELKVNPSPLESQFFEYAAILRKTDVFVDILPKG